jgi:hypothetical protein
MNSNKSNNQTKTTAPTKPSTNAPMKPAAKPASMIKPANNTPKK